MGRKPTPRALRIVRGNPGRRPLPPDLGIPPSLPDPPPHLSEMGRTEWARVATVLHAAGLITELDRAALAAYCVAYARWVEAEAKVTEYGPVTKAPRSGHPIQNPYLSIANRAMQQLVELSSEFGMTPSSRTKVHPGLSGDNQDRNPLAKLLAKQRQAKAAARPR